MKLLCKMFGHKMIKSETLDVVDPYTGEIGYNHYCDRCSYSKFEGSGRYHRPALIKLAHKRLDSLKANASKSEINRSDRVKMSDDIVAIQLIINKLAQL